MKQKLIKILGIPIIYGIITLSYNNYNISTKNRYRDTFSRIYRTISTNISFSELKKINKNLLKENVLYNKLGSIDTVAIKKNKSVTSSLEKIVDKNIYNFISQKHRYPSKIGINYPNLTIIASSNIAEGLANYYNKHKEYKEEISNALDNIIQTNISSNFNPYKNNFLKINNYDNYGLYLSHLNIILGEYERVAQNGKYFTLNTKISRYLAKKSLSDPRKHMSSFKNNSLRFPADQAALLFSLYLYDKNFGTEISKEPINKWLKYMKEKGTDKKSGLHISEVTGRTKYSNIPRGCALSWTIKYMAKFAPEEAKKLWGRYKDEFLVDYFVFAGFREYPKGSKLKPDIDSGPIFNGIGASATAFGLGAANAMGDKITYFKINNTYILGKIGVLFFANRDLQKVSSDLLSSAIIFSSRNQ